MNPPALVLVNPRAGGGRGRARLGSAWPAIASRFEPRAVALDDRGCWRDVVDAALAAGVRHFVAAGGDGTVGALANALWTARAPVPLPLVTLGAVGLGSSNDFHKPVRSRVGGVPVRLGTPQERDLARVCWVDESGTARQRVFLVSASLGLTAAANAFFNEGGGLVRLLRRRWTSAAILYAAVRTILRGRGVQLELYLPGRHEQVCAASLGVLKTPHLAGGLVFDTPVARGGLAVNLVEDRGRLETLRTLAALARGRFAGRRGSRHWSVRQLGVAAARPLLLEIDGEVVRARRAFFDVLPERIGACA
jgi:diacylglycerol kinase (ATP)